MRKRKHIVKIITFVIILLATTNWVSGILKKPLNDQWEASGLDNVWNNRKEYDVLFCGPSMSITNISSEELYLQNGITSITIGAPFQPMYLSYYALKDALIVQNPKVVILDITSLFYDEEGVKELLKIDEHHYLHYTLDGIHSLKNKYDAFAVARELDPDLNVWNYFSNLYYSHSNWENISKNNFTGTHGKCVMNGNLMLYDINKNNGREMSPYEIENNGEYEDISNFNLQYLEKIIKLCRQKNTELVLLNGKVDFQWDWKKYNTVKRIAEENQLEYLDVNLFEDEAQINWAVDLSDDRHTNVIGTKKITDYIGNYLSTNFECTEKKSVSKFEKNRERYNQIISAMESKQELYKADNNTKLLTEINNLDKRENTIIVCFKGILQPDTTEKDVLAELKLLGLKKLDNVEETYIGIVTDKEAQEWIGNEKQSYVINSDENIKIGIDLNELSEDYGVEITGCDKIELHEGINVIAYNSDIGVICHESINNG